MDLLDRFSLEHRVVQAGMADISRSALAAAVSKAGGLGTIGLSPPALFEADILDTIHQLDREPFAVNLLMPFVLKEHVSICLRNRIPIVTMFFGLNKSLIESLQSNGSIVIMQIGSLGEARQALDCGVDGLIVQGTEAGGHVRGDQTLSDLLPTVRETFPEIPVLAAGGIHDKQTAINALGLGADGVVSGTRFLMSYESFAHEGYKRRLIEAEDTVLTNLFGIGWPDKHRVLANGATKKWTEQGEIPLWLKVLHRSSRILAKSRADRRPIVSRQSLSFPLYTPSPMKPGMADSSIEVTALYAGECVSKITKLESARIIVDAIAA